MSSSRAVRSDAAETIENLMNVAERLFAEDGIENVALTGIVAASGQKNRSALHYHFGSREGVLQAVLNRRLTVINERRNALLDEIEHEGATAVAVVRASLLALALTTVEQPWGAHYVSILAQVIGHLQRVADQGVDQDLVSSGRRSRALIERELPHVPAAVMAQRLRWLNDSAALALARWLRDTPAKVRTREALERLVDQLATYGAAGLGAPIP